MRTCRQSRSVQNGIGTDTDVDAAPFVAGEHSVVRVCCHCHSDADAIDGSKQQV